MEPSTNLFDLNKDQTLALANSIKAKLKELALGNLGFTLHKQLTFHQHQPEKQGFIVIDLITLWPQNLGSFQK